MAQPRPTELGLRAVLGLLLILCALQAGAEARCPSTAEWKSRTIYQVVTDRFSTDDGTGQGSPCVTDDASLAAGYCGGTFKGLQRSLGYIQGMGFDAIWISPFFANMKDGYHGYWPKNIYEVNPRFSSKGTVEAATQELKDLIRAAHDGGMLVMLDIVPNHMGGDCQGGPCSADPPAYASFVPFDKPEHFHACNANALCAQDCTIKKESYDIVNNCVERDRVAVEQCRETHGLIDLNDSHPFVRSNYTYWIQWVEKEFDFDGWRADSTKHMPIDFWKALKEASSCYTVGEVLQGDPCFVGSYQREGAMDGLMSYPLYFTLRDVFGSRDRFAMSSLGDRFWAYKNSFNDPDALGTFLDNHDVDRFFTFAPFGDEQRSEQLLRSALVYVLFSQGIPIVYYGTEQYYKGRTNDSSANRAPLWWSHFDTSTPLYKFLAHVIRVRKDNKVWSFRQQESWSAPGLYAFARGPVLVALTNQNDKQEARLPRTSHNYQPGQKVCNIFYPQADCQTVGQDGSFNVVLLNGEQKIFVPQLAVAV